MLITAVCYERVYRFSVQPLNVSLASQGRKQKKMIEAVPVEKYYPSVVSRVFIMTINNKNEKT